MSSFSCDIGVYYANDERVMSYTIYVHYFDSDDCDSYSYCPWYGDSYEDWKADCEYLENLIMWEHHYENYKQTQLTEATI